MNLVLLLLLFLALALIMEIAAIALKLTGMDLPDARFQALSALTSTGFTTSHAEQVVSHPVRRRIVMVLMVVGHVGLAVIVITLFGAISSKIAWWHVLALAVLAIAAWWVISDRWLLSLLDKRIEKSLARGTFLRKRPVEEVLRLGKDHAVAEIVLGPEAVLVGKSLQESNLREHDVLVLAIHRAKTIIHAPHAAERLQVGDVLVVYGASESIAEMARQRGESFRRI